ncbi:MAG: RNA-binding S4 domain-containing protein [Alphaproteobacteria bacterium]|nr:RNA-binding S4 domain-containing protein [Alphaproteobacteria bacterium]
MVNGTAAGQRLDQWLWRARFFKTRALAAKLCQAGRVRVNRRPVQKAHHILRVGDVLTFPQAGAIRVVQVEALAERRGPAPEAARLYANLDG